MARRPVPIPRSAWDAVRESSDTDLGPAEILEAAAPHIDRQARIDELRTWVDRFHVIAGEAEGSDPARSSWYWAGEKLAERIAELESGNG